MILEQFVLEFVIEYMNCIHEYMHLRIKHVIFDASINL